MAVWLPRILANSLGAVGSRCRITTKAAPVLAGSASNRVSRARIPPADAPMPTTVAGATLLSVLPPAIETPNVARHHYAVCRGLGHSNIYYPVADSRSMLA